MNGETETGRTVAVGRDLLPEVAQALLDPQVYPDKPDHVELIQTQMSFVFLAGLYAYKVKKAVNLGYLDYTSLSKRRFYCEQEVLLNSRLCPEFYLGVVPIIRSTSGIAVGGQGEVIEYAVKMHRLPREKRLDALLEADGVSPEMLARLASKLAAFHFQAESNEIIRSYGRIEAIRLNTDENFAQTEKFIGIALTPSQYQRIKDFTERLLTEKEKLFEQRMIGGRIRDCHGDLYAQHICFCDGICVFDCIEFNDRFRYIDVASEIAFIAMDLDLYGRADLSRGFVEAYAQASQDSGMEELLKFYKTYRAYVRGKVHCFIYDDPYISTGERDLALEAARGYFDLAASYARPRPLLLITVGLAGSGKTTLAGALARRLGLTVISSDIVRKEMAGVPLTEHRFGEMQSGIYSPDFSRRTYERMFAEAEKILKLGDPVILDATFVKADGRLKAQKLAKKVNADFMVIECHLDEEETQRRLGQRLKEPSVSDGRWEVYQFQKKEFEPVIEMAIEKKFIVDGAKPLQNQITALIERLD